MTELKEAELKTVSLMEGPWDIQTYETEWVDGRFGRYERGLLLTVANKAGVAIKVHVNKRDLAYHRFQALLLAHPEIKKINITYDQSKNDVIISGAL